MKKTKLVGSAKAPKAAKKNRVRCSDCPLKPGIKDDNTLCPTCAGEGYLLV